MYLGEAWLAVLLFMAFLVCIYGIIHNKRKSKALDLQRELIVGYHKKAEEFLSRAKNIATFAAIEQPFAVCEGCGMIRTRYVQDENGITCIECAEKHTDRN
jgi:hypothetical protein